MFKQIFVTFLFAAMAVSFVVLFTQSFRLLSFVIDNSSTILVFFRLMGLMVPTFLPLIVPISFGIAVLFIYHKFAIDSELVVMRATGLSPLRMAYPALMMGLLVVMFDYGLTLWVTPAANRALVALQYKVRDDYSAYMIKPGTFNDLAEGLTFYARSRSPGGGMKDILVHDVRDPRLPVTIMAESGLMTIENDEPQVVVFNGRRQKLDVETGHLQELAFTRYVLDLHLLKNDDNERAVSPREMRIGRLWAARHGEDPSVPHKAGKLRAELHQRLGGPLLSFSFALIAVTVIIIGDFNRRGMTRRVLIAGGAIVIMQALMIGLVNQVAKYEFMVPLLYIVVLAPVPICLLLLDVRNSFFRRLRTLLSKNEELL
ncbi:MAG: LptF/LptG family permease [Bdellovibrionales bacterium]